VQHQLATVRRRAVLEQVDALPGAEHRPAAIDRDRELGLGERRLDVRGHVVRPFVLVPIGGALGDQAAEEGFEIGAGVRRGVLLHQQRGRAVRAPDGQQAGDDWLGGDPAAHRLGDLDETLAVGRYGVPVEGLPHSADLCAAGRSRKTRAWRR